MNIEVMTVKKSCERACAHCSYARKERVVEKTTKVNDDVQETFNFIERNMIKNQKYSLFNGVPSLPMLEISKPELIYATGFQTNEKEISFGVNNFSRKVEELLKEKKIKPKQIFIPITTKSHILSENEVELALSIIKELKSWFFLQNEKSIALTFDKDFGVKEDLREKYDDLLECDRFHLIKALKSICLSPVYGKEKTTSELQKICITYNTSYKGEIDPKDSKNLIFLNHRVISPLFVKEKGVDAYTESIKYFLPQNYKDIALLISPDGVMLTHSTVVVNNPIFWVSHNDFRESYLRIQKEYPNPADVIQELFWQNRYLYSEAQKIGIPDSTTREYFENKRWLVYS